MVKIAIDTLPLSTGHAARGVGVYTKNVISSVEKLLSKSKNLKLDKFVFKDEQQKLSEYSLVHYPYFDLFYRSLPVKKVTKTVVTIHDVIPLLYPKHYPPGVRGKFNFLLQKRALKSVDAIITVSETSKKDIVRFLNVPKEKIFPIYEAPNFSFKKESVRKLSETKTKFGLPDEFILYVGDVNWNKNLVNLAKAVKSIKRKLVIVGKQAVNASYDKNHIENAPLRALQEEYGNDADILRLGYVEDEDLNSIWQLAALYCLPSLYEGFGLSVVEAMDAEVPVVCARTQALVEVAADAAVYFDPKDVKDIGEKLEFVLVDKKLQKQLILKGEERVKMFSWRKTAEETLLVYRKILQI